MALIGNYSVLYKTAGSWRSGGATGQGLDRPNFNKSGPARNRFQSTDPKSSVPSGYKPGLALVIAQKTGGMAASTTIAGDAAFSGAGALGRNAESLIAGAGEISNAALALVLSAVAGLSGSGAVSAAIAGRLDAAAALAGSGDVDAALGAIAGCLASIAGAGTVSAALPEAVGSLSADIVVTGTALSTANVAAAILDAVNAIETGVTLRQATRLILAAAAGKVSGAAGTTVTIRNAVADDTDRIVATVDSNGNRTAITTDLD